MSDKSESTKSVSHTPLQPLAGVLANTSFLGVRGQMGCTEYQVYAMVTQESAQRETESGKGGEARRGREGFQALTNTDKPGATTAPQHTAQGEMFANPG